MLVDAQRFAPFGPAGPQNPFPASFNFLKERCLQLGKPLALVFNKSDLNRSLTPDVIASFPIVRQFREDFGAGQSGLVELISCYQLDAAHEVVQERDGSIFRPEPREIFIQVLRAVWPSARQRLENERHARDNNVEADRRGAATRKLRTALTWAFQAATH
jgi:hypothetical protein